VVVASVVASGGRVVVVSAASGDVVLWIMSVGTKRSAFMFY